MIIQLLNRLTSNLRTVTIIFLFDNARCKDYITQTEYSEVDHERFYQGNEGAF